MDTGTNMCACTSFEYSAQTQQIRSVFTQTAAVAAVAAQKTLKHHKHPVFLSVYMENAVHSSDMPISHHSRSKWVKTFVFTCAHVVVFVRESTFESNEFLREQEFHRMKRKCYFVGSHACLFTAECCWCCVTCTALSTYGLVWQLLLKSKHPP